MIVGVLGGGQLGRMLGLAGIPLGLRFRFFEPASDAPAAAVGAIVHGTYEDQEALRRFVDGVDVVTYEFENVPVAAAQFLQTHIDVFPPPLALETAQDRLVEKQFFRDLDIPTPPFAAVDDRADLDAAITALGLPAVLKTRRMGYDGKGQMVLRSADDVARAWQTLGGTPLILEGFVPFKRELSILAVRSRTGETAFYPLVENQHREGILRRSTAPAPNTSAALQASAEAYAARALDALGYVGVLAIELFETDDQLLVNECAPRVHNSGHWTIEGAATSQFANHMRAVVGLPLGSTALRGTSVMLNIIGDVPDQAQVLAVPDTHLHLYDKAPRAGRKLGHITLVDDDAQAVNERAARVEALL